MQPLGENMSNIPAFLSKLWKMVNDPNTNHLIYWSAAGNSFIIQNQAQFWYELLPLYYKHNNMSSFVRQLNMYGFHKISTIDNGSMDSDKDEIHFYHKYFQKGQPELLRNIKRKVAVSKSENNEQYLLKFNGLDKVLSDVKHLYGRQSSVDSQLTSMKQENAVLWRELAMLRQKHLKQQQIVNKLIQFLVTLVQPTPSARMGVSVKRRMPLMLHESPAKKPKTEKGLPIDNGLTIHELDSEMEMFPEELLEQQMEETNAIVTSPKSSVKSPVSLNDSLKSPSVSATDRIVNSALPENIFAHNEDETAAVVANTSEARNPTDGKALVNPDGGNSLLSSIANGSYNANALNNKNGGKGKVTNVLPESVLNNFAGRSPKDTRDSELQVATRINNIDDLDSHLESTQSEIEQLKDILKGCNTLDANALLGLFNEETPSYGLSGYNYNDVNKDIPFDVSADPMVSGTELTTPGHLIDFNELFDDSLDSQRESVVEDQPGASENSINTPMVLKSEPIFPNFEKNL